MQLAARAAGTLAIFFVLLAACGLILFALPAPTLHAKVVEWVRRHVLRVEVPGLFSRGAYLDPRTLERASGVADSKLPPPSVIQLEDPDTGEFIQVTERAVSMRMTKASSKIFLQGLQGMITGDLVRIADNTRIPSNISLVQYRHPEQPFTVVAVIPTQPKQSALANANHWTASVEFWDGTVETIPGMLLQVEVGSHRASLVGFITGVEGLLSAGRHTIKARMRGPNYREAIEADFDVEGQTTRRTRFRHDEMFGECLRAQRLPNINFGTWDVDSRPDTRDDNQLIMMTFGPGSVYFAVPGSVARLHFGSDSSAAATPSPFVDRGFSTFSHVLSRPGTYPIWIERAGQVSVSRASLTVSSDGLPVLTCGCPVAEFGDWIVADLSRQVGHAHDVDNHPLK